MAAFRKYLILTLGVSIIVISFVSGYFLIKNFSSQQTIFRLKQNGKEIPYGVEKSNLNGVSQYKISGVISGKAGIDKNGILKMPIEVPILNNQGSVKLNVIFADPDYIGFAKIEGGELGQIIKWETKSYSEIETFLKKGYQTQLYITVGFSDDFVKKYIRDQCGQKCEKTLQAVRKYGNLSEKTLNNLTLSSNNEGDVGVVTQLIFGDYQ